MKGVLGVLLLILGLVMAYLVLAGKFPLQLKPATTTTKPGTGGGPDSPHGDIRPWVPRGTPGRPIIGYAAPQWSF